LINFSLQTSNDHLIARELSMSDYGRGFDYRYFHDFRSGLGLEEGRSGFD
jgi:hypothetical protein